MKYLLLIAFAILVGCATTDHAAYQAARSLDSVEAYDAFLAKYPGTSWRESAIYYRDRAALKAARDARDIDAIKSFIQKYPKSDWLPQAEYYLKYGFRD